MGHNKLLLKSFFSDETSFKINFCISGLPEPWITPTRRDFLCFLGLFFYVLNKFLNHFSCLAERCQIILLRSSKKMFRGLRNVTQLSVSSEQITAAIFHLRVEPFLSTSASVKWTAPTPVAVSNRGEKKASQKDLLNVFHRPDMAALSSYQCASLMYKKKNWTCRINMQRGKCNKTLERRRLNKQHYHGRRHLEEDLRTSPLQSPFSSSPSFPLFSIFPND